MNLKRCIFKLFYQFYRYVSSFGNFVYTIQLFGLTFYLVFRKIIDQILWQIQTSIFIGAFFEFRCFCWCLLRPSPMSKIIIRIQRIVIDILIIYFMNRFTDINFEKYSVLNKSTFPIPLLFDQFDVLTILTDKGWMHRP